jgi:Cys-tRNA(Pro) deacylase
LRINVSEEQDNDHFGVETVARFLRDHGITVQLMPADTSTAASAAETLGTGVAAIVKSLLFMHESSPFLALVSGTRTVNRERLASVLGVQSVRLARPQEVLSETGYAVGGVPPVAHRRPMRVVMDRHLTHLPMVYAAAGSSVAIFEIQPGELSRLANAEVADFAD